MNKFVLFLLLALLADAVCTVLLYLSVHSWHWVSSIDEFGDGISDFHDDTADCFMWFVARAVLVPVLSIMAVKLGQPIAEKDISTSNNGNGNGNGSSNGHGNRGGTNKSAVNGDSERTPLLSSVNGRPTGAANVDINGDDDELIVASEEEEEDEKNLTEEERRKRAQREQQRQKKKKAEAAKPKSAAMKVYEVNERAALKRNICVALLFSFNMVSQGYIGIKCISFSFDNCNETVVGVLMGVLIVLINMQSAFSKTLATQLTRTEAHFIPHFHIHPLYYVGELPGRRRKGCV